MNPNQILQRAGGLARRATRQGERLGRRTASDAYGLFQRARHLRSRPKPDMDDVTLARKVETEIFRAADSPKATVNVNVVDGVVELRGQVKRPEQIKDLERQAAAIPEVKGVENLLHLPKTPAPTRTS
jgi:osmotically-inducible protein OsmY